MKFFIHYDLRVTLYVTEEPDDVIELGALRFDYDSGTFYPNSMMKSKLFHWATWSDEELTLEQKRDHIAKYVEADNPITCLMRIKQMLYKKFNSSL